MTIILYIANKITKKLLFFITTKIKYIKKIFFKIVNFYIKWSIYEKALD